jgi:hypothetical protein
MAAAGVTGAAIGGLYRGVVAGLRNALGDNTIHAGDEIKKGIISGMIDGVTGFLGLRLATITLAQFKSRAARYIVSATGEAAMDGLAAMFQIAIEYWPNLEAIDRAEIITAGLIGAGFGAIFGLSSARTVGKEARLRAASRGAQVRQKARQMLGDTAAEAAVRLRAGDIAERGFVEKFLARNVDNHEAMMTFYRRLGWNGVKELAGKIDDRIFKAIHWARDRAVRQAWDEVGRAIGQKYGVRLAAPYVGSPPGSAGYKGAFSDIDLSVQVKGGSKVAAPQRVKIEMEAMELMQEELRTLTPTPGLDLDVNVYLQPTAFPLAHREAVQRVKRFSRLMDFYEIRVGYGKRTGDWNAYKSRTLKLARSKAQKRNVKEGFARAEARYDNYLGKVKRARETPLSEGKAKGPQAEEMARDQVRRETEQRLKRFLDEKGNLLMGSGRKAEAARAEYNMLQMEMRATWPEAYISGPAARLGAAGGRAEALATRMSGAELSRAQVSQARFILDWLGQDTGAVIRAWKVGKYQMRDLELLEKAYGWLPPAEKEWIAFLRQMKKKAHTPQEAWRMWLKRHSYSEGLAEEALRQHLDLLRWQTEEFLAQYTASRSARVPGG